MFGLDSSQNQAIVNLLAIELNAKLMLVAKVCIPEVAAKAINATSKAYSTRS
jgi:hypothetical protein